VKDTSGEPIIGASVLEKGTTNGIITDLDGNFSLQAKKGSVLVVSFIGYKTQEVTVNSVQFLKITLLEDSKTLDEVVVIGYGTQRKEAVTGSVASMRGDDLRQIPTGNVTAALQNRVAGVEMTQTSSKPGAGMQIRIRGVRSLSASNDPLIVLDGIPFAGSINDIDPNSIKSLDILKDASATAIYGSRGANGVILITTIRGNAGQKPQVTYNGYYGIKNAIEFPMMNGPEFAELRRQAARTIKDLGLSASPVTNSEDESDETNTNYQDLMYRTGVITNHDINVSKGTDDGNYAFGASYYLDQAPIPTQQYSRLALRASVDQKLGKYMKVGLSSNSSYSLSQGSQINTGDALASSPLSNPYNEDGTIKRAVKSGPTDIYKVWTKDLLEKADDKWMSDTKSFASYNSLYGEVSTPWIEGLKYRINVGLNVRTTKGGGFTGIGVTSTTDPNAPSSASVSNTLTTNWAVENMLTYDRTFNKHNINVVALYSAEQTHYDRTHVAVRDLPADHFQYYDLSKAEGEVTITPNNQGYYESGLMSYMGRAMYSYDDRYMASVTFRADASSRLAKGHQWHSYPAVSLGWNLHKESFMQDFGWLDQLKLRVGYGETSNQSVNPYQTLGLLGTNKYNFGTTYLTGYELSQLPNPKLGWEYTTTWNYGLNFSLFGNRLSGTIEYYSQHTKDILLSVNLPSTSGVGSYMANIGETQNRGFEISLNGVILENVNGWTWEAGVNFYHNQNELLSLASGQDNDEGNWWFKGHPINVIYDYQKIGIWQENDPYRNILEPGGNAGMIKVKYTGEYAEDGTPVRQINTDDRQIIEVDPNFQGGFNTRVAYKNWDLSIVGGFQNGGTLISTLYGGTSYLNMLNGRHGNVKVDYWTPENTGAKYPRPGGITSADNMKYANSMAMFSGSYMKVRTITVGYNVPKSFLEHLGVNDLRLYATVQNPFVLFSPYNNETGMDPEPNSLANENQAVTTQYANTGLAVVGYNTPATRNFLFGLKLTF
jgi:TonB-linked SusC/RagA family outer membrane protein